MRTAPHCLYAGALYKVVHHHLHMYAT